MSKVTVGGGIEMRRRGRKGEDGGKGERKERRKNWARQFHPAQNEPVKAA